MVVILFLYFFVVYGDEYTDKFMCKFTYLRRQTIPMARIASQIPTARVTMIMSDIPAITCCCLHFQIHKLHLFLNAL